MKNKKNKVTTGVLRLDLSKPGAHEFLGSLMDEVEQYGGVHQTKADREESKRRLAMIAAGQEVPRIDRSNCFEIVVNPMDVKDFKLVPIEPLPNKPGDITPE